MWLVLLCSLLGTGETTTARPAGPTLTPIAPLTESTAAGSSSTSAPASAAAAEICTTDLAQALQAAEKRYNTSQKNSSARTGFPIYPVVCCLRKVQAAKNNPNNCTGNATIRCDAVKPKEAEGMTTANYRYYINEEPALTCNQSSPQPPDPSCLADEEAALQAARKNYTKYQLSLSDDGTQVAMEGLVCCNRGMTDQAGDCPHLIAVSCQLKSTSSNDQAPNGIEKKEETMSFGIKEKPAKNDSHCDREPRSTIVPTASTTSAKTASTIPTATSSTSTETLESSTSVKVTSEGVSNSEDATSKPDESSSTTTTKPTSATTTTASTKTTETTASTSTTVSATTKPSVTRSNSSKATSKMILSSIFRTSSTLGSSSSDIQSNKISSQMTTTVSAKTTTTTSTQSTTETLSQTTAPTSSQSAATASVVTTTENVTQTATTTSTTTAVTGLTPSTPTTSTSSTITATTITRTASTTVTTEPTTSAGAAEAWCQAQPGRHWSPSTSSCFQVTAVEHPSMAAAMKDCIGRKDLPPGYRGRLAHLSNPDSAAVANKALNENEQSLNQGTRRPEAFVGVKRCTTKNSCTCSDLFLVDGLSGLDAAGPLPWNPRGEPQGCSCNEEGATCFRFIMNKFQLADRSCEREGYGLCEYTLAEMPTSSAPCPANATSSQAATTKSPQTTTIVSTSIATTPENSTTIPNTFIITTSTRPITTATPTTTVPATTITTATPTTTVPATTIATATPTTTVPATTITTATPTTTAPAAIKPTATPTTTAQASIKTTATPTTRAPATTKTSAIPTTTAPATIKATATPKTTVPAATKTTATPTTTDKSTTATSTPSAATTSSTLETSSVAYDDLPECPLEFVGELPWCDDEDGEDNYFGPIGNLEEGDDDDLPWCDEVDDGEEATDIFNLPFVAPIFYKFESAQATIGPKAEDDDEEAEDCYDEANPFAPQEEPFAEEEELEECEEEIEEQDHTDQSEPIDEAEDQGDGEEDIDDIDRLTSKDPVDENSADGNANINTGSAEFEYPMWAFVPSIMGIVALLAVCAGLLGNWAKKSKVVPEDPFAHPVGTCGYDILPK